MSLLIKFIIYIFKYFMYIGVQIVIKISESFAMYERSFLSVRRFTNCLRTVMLQQMIN